MVSKEGIGSHHSLLYNVQANGINMCLMRGIGVHRDVQHKVEAERVNTDSCSIITRQKELCTCDSDTHVVAVYSSCICVRIAILQRSGDVRESPMEVSSFR
jgi:hypothetical protein